MAPEWSIRCSFISHGPVHLRKWEKARQTHGPDVADFIRYFHTNWIYPVQPLSDIRQIIHTLLSACFHTILSQNPGKGQSDRWSFACVRIISTDLLNRKWIIYLCLTLIPTGSNEGCKRLKNKTRTDYTTIKGWLKWPDAAHPSSSPHMSGRRYIQLGDLGKGR